MQHKPTKQKEGHHPCPKNPFILPRPPLHPPNRIPTDPQRIGNVVHAPLRPLEHIPLLTEIGQNGSPAIEKLVDLGVGVGEEGLFSEGPFLATEFFRAET